MAQGQSSSNPTPMKLYGATEASPAGSALDSTLVTVRAEFRPGRPRERRPVETVVVKPDDVIEIEFTEGQRLWLRGDDYCRQFGGEPSRDVTGAETVIVPEGLGMLPRGMQSRGPVKWAINSLKVLGIDLAGKTAKTIGEAVDRRRMTKRPGLGLYRCSMESDKFSLTPLARAAAASDKPYLLFLHGTASSTWGSFGSLWGPARARELKSLRDLYGDRVLAYEHGTLSVSPIENALGLLKELVKKIPSRAALHLVTHSRGGLVGEVLCRAGRGATATSGKKAGGNGRPGAGWQPFTDKELQLFRDKEEHKRSLAQLEELSGLLRKPFFTVERFARVGCPALGTTLASRRLDRWLSVVGSVASLMPDTPVADVFKDIGDFAAAVIKERTDPAELPGLEAMMPESLFIKLVNWPTTTIPGDLTVIAGDIEPDALWAKLLVFATDRFYEGDHDLVVNTPSMYGGAARTGRSLVSFHKGPGVNHFTYFSNRESAEQLVRALTISQADAGGFEPLKKPTIDIARAIVPRSAEPRPIVFVLPGIMGSELTVGRQPVWVDIQDLLFGGLRKLNIKAKNVQATQPFVQFYGDLLQFLAQTHKVIPFPFDWRLPPEHEADRLMALVRQEFADAARQHQPIRFLAHSMGGLVVRTMIARHTALWRELCAHQDARFVMLGTPNGGSHAITELLVGQSSLFSQLAFVDIKNSQEDLLQIVSRFPGILAMLPVDAADDYFSAATWQRYTAGTVGLVAPSDDDLERAREFRRLLDSSPIDPHKMVYVAGRADVTLTRMFFDPNADRANEFIKFLATTRGDGRVTWDSGIPAEVPTWYMDVEHGDLPAHEESFPAFLDLLQNGTTTRLSKNPPVSRSADEVFPRPPVIDDFYPQPDDLAASAVGAPAGRRKRTKPREARVEVRVVHGNLAFASYPVAVGHYAGDTIISAEADLDRRLDGELTRRASLGLYPGALETCAIFVHPRLTANDSIRPKGAIVVGLGTPGLLSAAEITKSFLKAMLQYALEWTGYVRASTTMSGLGVDAKLKISALLIGTGAGGVSVSDSVYALVKAIARANETLAEAKQAERIAGVEFIELWEDRVIQAVRAFKDCEADPSLNGRFTFDPNPHSTEGGLRRVTYEEPGGWWHRVQILGGDDHDAMRRTLRFTATTKRARNEVSLLPTQRTLVDRFVEEAIRSTHDNQTVSRTLFELLLPKQLKLQAPDQDDIVLLLDEAAAQYPWELLADTGGTERRPFAIEHGVLRQLETTEFTDSIRPVIEKDALVIGDPISSFVELKGAQAEADAVARSLTDGHFHVELRKRATGDQVMQALYARPYQILHLAGHGVYRYLPPQVGQCAECGQELSDQQRAKQARLWEPITGMVIGDNAYLTPAEVQQLPRVPDLVFINCCHLGKIEPTGGKDLNDRRDYNKIAANVATEFIRMGVRAVVAAGWAVDDAAALTFSTTFYNHMVGGAAFGEAVKAARQAAYAGYSQTNTWGAYQCYGDPDFRLVKKDEEGDAKVKEPTFASPAEAIAMLENIAARLCTKADDDQRGDRDQLAAVVKLIEKKGWLQNGALCIALARAYRDAELFDEAIYYYRHALSMDSPAVKLEDIEQLANLLGRRAVRRYEQPPHASVARGRARTKQPRKASYDPISDIDEAIGLLQWLIDAPQWRHERDSRRGETHERDQTPEVISGASVGRLCLLGSAYKRRAWLNANARTALSDLRDANQAYQKAYKLSVSQKKPDLYALQNSLVAEMILSWQPRLRGKRGRRRSKDTGEGITLAAAKELLSTSGAERTTFWNEINQTDFRLIEMLITGKVEKKTLDLLANQYVEVRRLANRRKFASVLDQLSFLEAMATKLGRRTIAQALAQLSRRLLSEGGSGDRDMVLIQ
jgi:tetratricopeptide (TPR) repeat protein